MFVVPERNTFKSATIKIHLLGLATQMVQSLQSKTIIYHLYIFYLSKSNFNLQWLYMKLLLVTCISTFYLKLSFFISSNVKEKKKFRLIYPLIPNNHPQNIPFDPQIFFQKNFHPHFLITTSSLINFSLFLKRPGKVPGSYARKILTKKCKKCFSFECHR